MTEETSRELTGRRVILGITGGIAAYKAAELVRLYRKAGAEVQVVMTPNATRFVTPLTLGTLSEREVFTEVFPENKTGSWTRHIEIGLWGDVYVVAPATAQTVSKLAGGMCDSMLTAVALAARCPMLVCPAMDHDMYEHAATRENLEKLVTLGYEILEAEEGELASGLVGRGRLPEPETIYRRTVDIIEEGIRKKKGALSGRKILVSAGPTREALDPVRFLSNRSTGTMGYEIAAAAARRGADVLLVSGPTALSCPDGVRRINVTSTDDMDRAMQSAGDAEFVFMVAAVADYTPVDVSSSKIKKSDSEITLRLKSTPDILLGLGRAKRPGQTLVGFALETDDGPANARKKLEKKNLDWIVLNNPSEEGAGFGTSTNHVTVYGRDGSEEELPVMPKREIAEFLLDLVTK
jgi:phosphopantothenoylcysteine decarboxylase/phosphopantothenate--cysteine ligase